MYTENQIIECNVVQEPKKKKKRIWNRKLFLVPFILILLFALVIGGACIRREIQKKEFMKIATAVTDLTEGLSPYLEDYRFALGSQNSNTAMYIKADTCVNKCIEAGEKVVALRVDSKGILWTERSAGEINLMLYHAGNYFQKMGLSMVEDKRYYLTGNQSYKNKAVSFLKESRNELESFGDKFQEIRNILGIKKPK